MTSRIEPRETDDDNAASDPPRIVNGMPYRPRKKISLREGLGIAGLAILPDVLLLLALIPLGVRRGLKYLDAKRWLPDRVDGTGQPSAKCRGGQTAKHVPLNPD